MEKEKVGTIRACPACGKSVESFQAKCVCGHEFNSIQVNESVQVFFQKLEELSRQEVEAAKKREGASGKKAKRKQPKIVVLCEAVAVISVILLLLHITGIADMLRPAEIDWRYDVGASYVTFIISNDSEYDSDEVIFVTVVNKEYEPVGESNTLLLRGSEVGLSGNADYYLVYAMDPNQNEFYYPGREPVRMSGTINLSFDGMRFRRYIERNDRIIFQRY